jgi:hypothetical protein
MKWFRRKPPAPMIPPYPPIEVKPQPKEEPGIVVTEIDTSDMTKTGVHRAFDKLAGRFK